MNTKALGMCLAAALLFTLSASVSAADWQIADSAKNKCPDPKGKQFTDQFFIEECTFSSVGDNPFFPLTPGLVLELEGEEDGTVITTTISVLYETRVVDGVTTRIVEERETEDGELVEVSRNFFAECAETSSVFYFGEEVDDYENGEIVGHGGEWLAGVNGARAGIIMPGTILAGSRYYQEVAPGVALDRAEHVQTGITVDTEAGTFENCLEVADSSPFGRRKACDRKVYCPGVGLVIDEVMELVSYTPAP